MKTHAFTRLLCLALCLLVVIPCVTVPAAAEQSGKTPEVPAVVTTTPNPTVFPEAEDTVWEFDFTDMGNTVKGTYTSEEYGNVSLGLANFELDADGLSLKSGKVNGTTRVYEPKTEEITSAQKTGAVGNSFIANYDKGCLILTLVVEFDALPTVTASAPNENILSFITWEQKYYNAVGAAKTSTGYSRFLCIDENGLLYDNSRSLMSTTHKLEVGKEAEISIVMDPTGSSCPYDLYLDGEYVFSSSVPITTGVSGLTEACIRICDTRRSYDVSLKEMRLETVETDYTFGKILTADFAGYQTSAITADESGKETFDLRLISLIDTLDYTTAGYEITTAYRENDQTVIKKSVYVNNDVVYTRLNQTQNGQKSFWYADENGAKYAIALRYDDIDASHVGCEIRVRPYAQRTDGLKIYGLSQYLTYVGLDEDGRPHFKCSAVSDSQTLIAEEDTYVRFKTSSSEDYENTDYNDSNVLMYKWNATNYDMASVLNQNTRFTYLRFDLTKLEKGWTNYYLTLTYSEVSPNFTTEIYEVDNVAIGGSLIGLTGAEVRRNTDTLLSIEEEPIITFKATGSTNKIDITDYINQALASGKKKVFWRLEYNRDEVVEFNNSNHAVAKLYSAENGDASRAPAIVGAGFFNYETNLETYGNAGYEPWGYAELIVDDWYANIWDIYARDYGYSIMNGSEDTDSLAYVASDYSVKLDVKSGSSFKAIDARTVNSITGYTALSDAPEYDGYGGLAADGGKYYTEAYADKVNGTPGYFGTYYDDVNNRWWFITPEGNRYLALGICTVTQGSTTGQKALALTTYGDQGGAEWTSDLLNKIGLNTSTGSTISEAAIPEGNYVISTHSGVGMIGAYGSSIGVNASVGGSTVFANNNTLNVFDPDFVEYAYKKAESNLASKKDKAYYLGWTSDNEIPANTDMLIRYLTLKPTVDTSVVDDPTTHDDEKELEELNSRNAYSYAVAWTWLRKMTGKDNPTLEDAKTGYRSVIMGGEKKMVSYLDLFRGFVYYRYYSIASDAVKTADPNHLYLGCRELGGNYQCETVMRVAGMFCDVVTLNLYLGANPPAATMDNIHKWACKPGYVTEFYSKSAGVNASGAKSGTQAYSIWEVNYPALITPDANTYYTVDTVKTEVSGTRSKDTYYADGTAIWSVEYDAAGVSSGTKTAQISAYIAKSMSTVSVFYIANGTTKYRDPDGALKTVPEIILTNNRGAGKVVRSQDDRGVYYETFALKMLESGFCVGWSWYRYQDNDMPLFTDANGNLLYFNTWTDNYRYWEAGDGSGLTRIHKGENTDQSNLDANKGIVNNAMEEYTEFTSHISNIANNLYELADHFDQRRN